MNSMSEYTTDRNYKYFELKMILHDTAEISDICTKRETCPQRPPLGQTNHGQCCQVFVDR